MRLPLRATVRIVSMLAILAAGMSSVTPAAQADEACAFNLNAHLAAMPLGSEPSGKPIQPWFYYAAEGAGTSPFTIAISGHSCGGENVTVSYDTPPGTAAAGSDYTRVSGSENFDFPFPHSLVDPVPVDVPIVQDSLVEAAAESFTAQLTEAVGGGLDIPNEAPFFIVDDDGSTRVRFVMAAQSVNENATEVKIPVLRAGPTMGTVSYTITAGTADPATDITTPASGNVSFSSGSRLGTITVKPNNDNLNEGNETLNVSLGGVTTESPSTLTLTIVDDDASGHVLSVSKAGTGTGLVTSSPAGITCGADCSEAYAAGTTVTLTAQADVGSAFTGWVGDCSGTGSCIVTMNAPKSVTATFSSSTRTLSVSKTGTGAGTVTSNPAGITCGTDCSEAYLQGSTVTLTATPAAGSSFGGWSGACSGTGTCTVTMTVNRSVTATFNLSTGHTLTVTKDGTGTGTVTSNPAGITCGADCTETYAQGTMVTLTAAPASGSTFAGWSGACTGTGTCTVTMDAAKTATATFNQITHTLTVNKSGTGSGTVTSNPAGINCGVDCTESYAQGTMVTLTATPASGSTFGAWSGACSGTSNTCTVTMDAAKTAAATFNVATYTLMVSKSGSGTGTVTSNPAGIDCGGDCSETYNGGTSVTLTAAPAGGSVFGGWGGDCATSGTNLTCTLAMSANRSVTATFDPQAASHTLSVTKLGSGSGTVTSSPAGINCGADCTEAYPQGTTVTLTASPSGSASFGGWGGDCSGTSTCTVTMDAAKSVTATFDAPGHTLTVNKAGTGSGTVTSSPAGIGCGSDCSEVYPQDTSVTLTASPAANSTFAGWSGGGCSGMGSCVITMDRSRTVTATFDVVTHTLTVNKAGTGSGTVTSSPAGINCEADCSEAYVQGTMVTLTAIPASGSTFDGWSGACTGTGTCTVTMDAAKAATATFTTATPTTHPLTVAKDGTGSGTVTSSPAGINCGVDCSEAYLQGSSVTLTATPSSDSVFGTWLGDVGTCAGAPTCTVSMTSPRDVVATFTVKPMLTVEVIGGAHGTVTSNPAGIDCGTDCEERYDPDTEVTLTASPDPGYGLAFWQNGCSGTALTCEVTMDQARSVMATFADLDPPWSKFHHPKHDKTYVYGEFSGYKIKEMHVFYDAEGGSSVAKVQIAIRQKRTNGSCRWFKGGKFVTGPCGKKKWVKATFDPCCNWYMKTFAEFKPSVGTKVKFYNAYSRAIDDAGNKESTFDAGRNSNKFEVKKS